MSQPLGYKIPEVTGATAIIVAKLQSDVLIKEAGMDALPVWHDLRVVFQSELDELNRQLNLLD